MKRALLTALLVLAFGAAAACSAIPDVTPAGAISTPGAGAIPGGGNGITDVGTPVEEPVQPQEEGDCVYRNDAYGIIIFCPDDWAIASSGAAGVTFVSDQGVALSVAIVDLAANESLESFLHDVRGEAQGLQETDMPGFQETLCAPEEIVDEEKGLFTKECYYERIRETQHFVLVESGVTDAHIVLREMTPVRRLGTLPLRLPMRTSHIHPAFTALDELNLSKLQKSSTPL